MYSLLTHTSRYQNNSSARCTIVSTNINNYLSQIVQFRRELALLLKHIHSLSYSILDKMNNIILYNY